MSETLNGSLDLSSTNGFTNKIDQTNGGWPSNMAGPGGAWATQRAEWVALMAKRGFPNADMNNQNSLGTPEKNVPTNVVSNPGKGVQAENSGKPIVTTKNPDGSTASAIGQIPNTSVVCNLPAKLA